jgi:hypothetical protein
MKKFRFASSHWSNRKFALVFAALLGVLAAYCLPWEVGSGAGISFNAYDLAEWASLHPATHIMTPAMLPTLLLRVQLTLLAFALTLLAGRPFKTGRWWLSMFLWLALVVAQIPPFEYFTVDRQNTNYAQQLTLAMVSFMGGLVGLSGILERFRLPLLLIVGIAAVATAMTGVNQIVDLIRGFQLQTQIGTGTVLFVGCYVFLGVLLVAWTETS